MFLCTRTQNKGRLSSWRYVPTLSFGGQAQRTHLHTRCLARMEQPSGMGDDRRHERLHACTTPSPSWCLISMHRSCLWVLRSSCEVPRGRGEVPVVALPPKGIPRRDDIEHNCNSRRRLDQELDHLSRPCGVCTQTQPLDYQFCTTTNTELHAIGYQCPRVHPVALRSERTLDRKTQIYALDRCPAELAPMNDRV